MQKWDNEYTGTSLKMIFANQLMQKEAYRLTLERSSRFILKYYVQHRNQRHLRLILKRIYDSPDCNSEFKNFFVTIFSIFGQMHSNLCSKWLAHLTV